MSGKFSVAVLVGSLRKESFSRKLAHALMAQAPVSLGCRILEIGDLPLYNEDLDAQPPASWVRFRADLKEASAVLFVTPEYNRSIPGCLKNAVDVASRPSGKSVLAGRPAGVVSITPYNLGAFGANHAIRQTFAYLDMPVMQQPEAYISRAGELFDDHGKLANDATRDFLGKFMTAFAQWVERNSAQRASQSFDDFMKKRVDVANAYVNGNAAPLDGIVTREGPASFFPPNGGSELGPDKVNARYDKDSAVFTPGGETQLEVLHSAASGDVAYWTGFQSAKVKMSGGDTPVPMQLRITELFRRIDGEWKIVHRHADALAEPKKAEGSVDAARDRAQPQTSASPRNSQPSGGPYSRQ